MSAPLPGLEAHVLTERQQLALALIRQHGPLSSEELGARVREARGGRESGAQWDVSNGRSLGESLAGKGFVRYVRCEGWVDADYAPQARPSLQGDLPEGF